MLAWGIARCPALRERTADAVFPETQQVAADFSYRCEPYAGPGYFLAGDAATFVDPIFSTGACLGMMSGHQAGKAVAGLVRRGADPARARRAYVRFVKGSSEPFFDVVRLYYEHPFRELFMTGQGPFQMHRAVIGLLAGHVFPRPAFALVWRMRLFELCIRLQQLVPLAPRRPGFSLLAGTDEARPSGAEGETPETAEPAHGF